MHTIADILVEWYERCGRSLPWRETRDPYRIWLSEVILQQTRVAQGMDYYLRFTQRFPTVASLAAAEEDEVLKLWQGLGYYSRARNLHAAAKQIMAEFDGRFPETYEGVRSLRGVGDYTAAAVCAFAYDLPHAAVDGNFHRVLARLFDLTEPIDTGTGKKLFASLAQELLGDAQPSAYNQAVMDFGATLCTPAQPRCDECPLAERCAARAAGTVAERPVKQGRTHVRDRRFHYLHIVCGDRTVLHRRGAGDIWQGLYEFPLVETEAERSEFPQTEEFRRWVGDKWVLRESIELPKHQLSHQRIHATVHRIEVEAFAPTAEACAVPIADVDDYAVPRLLERYLLTK